MKIKTHLQLSQLYVYVQREPQAEKKLTAKDPNSYGVGPTKLEKLNVTPVNSRLILSKPESFFAFGLLGSGGGVHVIFG